MEKIVTGIIIMPRGGVTKLAKEFKVSMPTIWAALRGHTKSNKAKMLREAALQRGGLVATKPSKID